MLAKDQFYVEDMNSRNGTTLNNRPVIRRQVLKDGDRLGFGGVEFVFYQNTLDPRRVVMVDTVRIPTIISAIDATETALVPSGNVETKM